VTSQSAVTTRKGKATFKIDAGGGTYVLTVGDISKAGSTFDPENSVLSASLTN